MDEFPQAETELQVFQKDFGLDGQRHVIRFC